MAALAVTALSGSLLAAPTSGAAAEPPAPRSAPSTALPDVPVPSVRGPVPSRLDAPGNNRIFFGTDLDIAGRGYVEEEFFYGGEANVYDATVAGGIGARPTPSPTAGVVSTGHDYTTRMVVRRPAKARDFNGTVVVEWLNATSGYDVEALWFRTHEYFLREGIAWVGITVQSAPITHPTRGLKAFSPTRCGVLDLTDGGRFTSGDPLSYDVFAQGLQAVRQAGVLGALQPEVETIMGAGVSQSAGRLSVYTNAVHVRTAPTMDAAPLYIGGERMRDDLDLPVFKVLSETEYTAPASANEISSLQPDSDRMRTWSVAGTSHSDWASFAVRYALLRRDQPSASLSDSCALPSRSRVPDRYTLAAAMDQAVAWSEEGTEPARGAGIALAADGRTVLRDELGNVLRGIRLAPFEVATALDTGYNENRPGLGGLCFLNGTHVPFDTGTLDRLYPSPGRYRSEFARVVNRNVREGFVLPEDAQEMLRDASASLAGRGLQCGSLCANVAQFPIQPSTQLLRDHTQFLYLDGGERLLGLLDRATRSVAEGQTDPTKQADHYARAVKELQEYEAALATLEQRGAVTPEQADLLGGYAQILIAELRG
ncbi:MULTISPECIES: alpha/beta hydrolase domain-containing protein [Nocardioides]|nr:alpha/beta hydrolase domain-containing protein [Nocardioides sp.]